MCGAGAGDIAIAVVQSLPMAGDRLRAMDYGWTSEGRGTGDD